MYPPPLLQVFLDLCVTGKKKSKSWVGGGGGGGGGGEWQYLIPRISEKFPGRIVFHKKLINLARIS